MLKELAKLAGGLLFLGGYVTDAGTARRLACDDEPATTTQRGTHAHAPGPRQPEPAERIETVLLAILGIGSFACIAFGALVLLRLPFAT